jgi:predicted enzyme related to lactoylglutathione lyase
MATVNYWAADVEAAKAWYTELLGIEPYFERPGGGQPASYLEYRVGDYQHELGLIDARFRPASDVDGPGGVIVYWAVDDVQAAYDRLLALGAGSHLPVTAQGTEGFITASVIDPFGNVLGVMENPHYQAVLGQQ